MTSASPTAAGGDRAEHDAAVSGEDEVDRVHRCSRAAHEPAGGRDKRQLLREVEYHHGIRPSDLNQVCRPVLTRSLRRYGPTGGSGRPAESKTST